MEENKKFSEMSLVDFVTDILKIELEEWQKQILKMYEENRFNKNNYIPYYTVYPNYPTWTTESYTPNYYTSPTIYYGDMKDANCITTGSIKMEYKGDGYTHI
jgi:hypothetical protein